MAKYSNNFNLPMSLSVWLLDDGYDHKAVADPRVFSVTELIKPIRQIVLGRRVGELPEDQLPPVDVVSLFNARVGQSVHAAIEAAWESDKLPDLLAELGISRMASNNIQINPTPDEKDDDAIVLYMEQRRTVEVPGTEYYLSGQYDFNFDGQLEDFKFTKTYAMTMGVNDEYYTLQGSLYKYIFPDQVTSDSTRISWLFGDWMQSRAVTANYPAAPIDSKEYALYTKFQTETYIRDKFDLIDKYLDAPETELPECTPEDLWQDATVWKYYANPANKARATKNFTEADGGAMAAAAHKAKQGKGEVVEVKGKIKACRFCKAFTLCTQKDKYLLSGQLDI